MRKQLKQNKVIGETFGEFRLAPPVHGPLDAPWHNVPLQTNPPQRYSPGNEVGTLLLTGTSASGSVNILFFVSKDKQELEIFWISVRVNGKSEDIVVQNYPSPDCP